MSAYVVMIRERVTDPQEMATYSQLAGRARGNHPLKPLAFYGQLSTLEGPPADGVVILEFPDMAAARGWYTSPAYQEALQYRLRGSEYRVVIVEGVPGPA